MPVWPKSFYFIGENLATARVARKLRRKTAGGAAQEKSFSALVPRLAQTACWREAGVEAGMSYAQFRTRVAPRTHGQLAPAIERMMRGEADVLWPGRAVFFVQSAGTTGRPKLLPVTEEMLAHFRAAAREALLCYTARIGHAGVARGRYLVVGGSTTLTPLAAARPHEAYAAALSGILALATPRWAEKHLLEPAAAISRIEQWDGRVAAIADTARRRDIALVAAYPNWARPIMAALLDKIAEGRPRAENLQALWPNLECYVHGGLSIAPYRDALRAALGPGVKFHEVYFAAEAIIAAQDGESGAGLRPLADAGVFFEFVPMADFDQSGIEQLGPKAVPLADVKTGVDYAVLVTTPGGLVRYVLGDIVRFNSVAPPRLLHVGRTELSIRVAGERVIEKEITDALVTVCHRRAWTIADFHVAPLVATTLTGAVRGRHEWWIELRPGTTATPTGPQMANELDPELQRLNPGYAALRRTGAIEAPFVRLVMPGVFEHWLRYQGRWGGHNKTPRSRNDRLIADELAQITSFARD